MVKEVNPRASRNRVERFLEAIAYCVWKAMCERKNCYILFCLNTEGLIEKAEK